MNDTESSLLDACDDYESFDAFFESPYIDVDEWRALPARHRYVHGGFEGCATRFSYYFPDAAGYGQRFVQHLEGGMGGNENTLSNETGPYRAFLGFALSCGAYVVETNQGHDGPRFCAKAGGDASVYGHRAAAECARFSRHLAIQIYGEVPNYGYLCGGSGGGVRSVLCMEKVSGLWDGAVPWTLGDPEMSSFFSAQLLVKTLLGSDKIRALVDTVDPGGSGDVFVGLDTDQREALARLYRYGFPRGGEWSMLPDGFSADLLLWTWEADELRSFDPSFFVDFWTEPGYIGADRPDLLAASRVKQTATVRRVLTSRELEGLPGSKVAILRRPPDTPLGIELDTDCSGNFVGARIDITTGSGAGRSMYCQQQLGSILVGGGLGEDAMAAFSGVESGDEISLDNRDFLAYIHYHRYRVEPERQEFRSVTVDGRPMFPSRPQKTLSPIFGEIAAQTGRINGKMVLLQNRLDTTGWPFAATSYSARVREWLGDTTDGQFRIWWNDNAEHVAPTMTADAPSRLINFEGAVQQAIRDVIAWVELDEAPPASTAYTYTADCALELPDQASERRGIQSVVSLRANGSARADVGPGEEVMLDAVAEVPAGAGVLIDIEWDLDGSGVFATYGGEACPLGARVDVRVAHAYEKPGIYFPSVRMTSSRHGDRDDPYGRVTNLACARVVVSSAFDRRLV